MSLINNFNHLGRIQDHMNNLVVPPFATENERVAWYASIAGMRNAIDDLRYLSEVL